ncbi:hypothetical protein AB0L28_29225 [Streptomyces sp. NPDC052503]|uniref:hypothetical protein n=1 Tax=Streptomyces sp. NPDC052503 TaxID=3156683 RepID=UPI00136BF489|nr:hypothetical protein [Streptomyces sp. SID7834]MYT57979.1 hypothetical protein [Streptomyces sp. SID7834]
MPVYELFLASLPEFVGSLMAATVLAATGWSMKKTRDLLRARRARANTSPLPQPGDNADA